LRRIQNAAAALSFSTSWTASQRLFRTKSLTSSSWLRETADHGAPERPVARRATHLAQLLAHIRDWPARSCQSMRDCRQNGLRQKTHFASRLKRIAASSPPTENISLSFFPKLVSVDAVPSR
jgi:hypothetical protein